MPRIPTPITRRFSRCGLPPALPTCWLCCWMTSVSAPPQPSAAPCTPPPPSGWRPRASSTTVFTPPPCAPPPARPCFPAATITRWALARSLRWPRRLRATTPCAPTAAPPWLRCSSSMAMPRPNSANVTRCRCGKPVRWGRSTAGPAAAAVLSISMASSVAKPTNTNLLSMRAPHRWSRTAAPRRATTSAKTSPARPCAGCGNKNH